MTQERIDGLVQERRNSIANALELRFSCTNPSVWNVAITLPWVNPSGDETGIFGKNYLNTMTADDLAPCIARSSAAMVLIMEDEQIHVFHEVGFQLPVPSQCWEMKQNANIFLCILNTAYKWLIQRWQNSAAYISNRVLSLCTKLINLVLIIYS